MKTLLRIDASIRQEQSHSRELAAHFQTRWLQKTPGGNIIYRDLAKDAPPHISRQLIDAFFSENGDPHLLALSDQYVAEWKAGDTILISTPMYNLSFPSTLKAYIDHLVRINQTFAYVPGSGYKGLLQGKQAVIIIAKGGFYKGVGQVPPDFLGKYLEGMLRFMGIEEIQLFVMEGTRSPDHAAVAMPEVKEEIDGFLSS
jgi:FMN-dependent NADH-azoreductase